MDGLYWLGAACIAFVGTHFLLSHPLRQPLVERYGSAGFMLLYSAVASVTLILVIIAYRLADDGAALWEVGDGLWGVVTFVMLLASILFAGSLIGNPALPGQTGAPARGRGVYAITRHPMMWSFAIWGLCHIAVFPTWPNIIVAGSIIFLAIVGAAAQDGKKRAQQPEAWRAWEARTAFWPFGLVGGGKYRKRDTWPGILPVLIGTLIWLGATWAHLPLAGWAAGIWRWLDPDVVQASIRNIV